MAFVDSADLLARSKALAQRPAVDEQMADPDWYALLTEAQAAWFSTIAAQAPWVLVGAPTLMTTADGGETYTFPSGIMPFYAEVYDAKDGRLLRPCHYTDSSGDYVWEGENIRFPRGITKSFPAGPYARYVAPPGVLDGTNQPTLQPPHARLLLVYRSAALWAERGGMRDPSPFLLLEKNFWLGNPQTGEVGLLGLLKSQNPWLGTGAFRESQTVTGLNYLWIAGGTRA